MANENLTVIQEPDDNTAGLGVRYDPDARYPDEPVTVEQLWPGGSTEPVYVPEDVIHDLIYELMRIHMDVMDND